MASPATAFLDSLDARSAEIVDACTRCGACVEACPTPAIAGIPVESAGALAGGVLDVLRGDAAPEASRRWADACCGTGHCIAACEHGINPRFMLLMARRAMRRADEAGARREAGKAAFKKMSRGVRVLSRLQLPPELLARLNPSSHPERASPPDVVFYTGCNLLKTPHIGLLCLDILDRLEIQYEVHGGPAACCGILQMRPGDTDNAGRQGMRTVERLAGTGAAEVLSWCPTCQIQFGETMLPSYRESRGDAFDMAMFPVWLAKRLDALAPMMTTPVEKRVALYEFPGALGVTDAVRRLLGAVPGITIVDLGIEGVGYQITSLATIPGERQRGLADLFRRAAAARVDTLAGVFHADHRELAAHESDWPFEVANYLELIGESLGLFRPDRFKRLKLMRDADRVLVACRDQIALHGLDPDEVRTVIVEDLLGEQHLPVGREPQPLD